jgi:hypothetical protein
MEEPPAAIVATSLRSVMRRVISRAPPEGDSGL